MLVRAIISYAMPLLTGRKLYAHGASYWAFWASNIGMVTMTPAFAVAGVALAARPYSWTTRRDLCGEAT